MTTHSEYMLLALQLARLGRFAVSPNPMVGCVIVNDEGIVGEGFHQRAGEPHAEIYALRAAAEKARNATAYVTLEPCCHHGKTPPCTDALIAAGIRKVYVACLDPNPLVAGNGIKTLRSAGIEVEVGWYEAEAKQLNEIFFHYMTHKRPFVIAKWAMSLDGKTVTHSQDSREISTPESRAATHTTRQEVDAILVGSRTAIHDNPLLTSRLPYAKQPIRIVLASSGCLPLNLKMFNPDMPAKTIVATTNDVDKNWHHRAVEKNIDVMILDKNNHGQVHLPQLLDELGKREITSLLVEGGMTLLENFFQENLVNKVHVYLAPLIIGSLEKKQFVKNLQMKQISHDFNFIADITEPTCLAE